MKTSLCILVLGLCVGCGSPSLPGVGFFSHPNSGTSKQADSGLTCIYNSDCPAHEHCKCRGACKCAVGERGKGETGVDLCKLGDDCKTALCLEGRVRGKAVNVCSQPCESDSDCKGAVPLCSRAGKFCVWKDETR